MEVIARIPRKLLLTPTEASHAVAVEAREPSWAAELTAAALLTLHPEAVSDLDVKRPWIEGWGDGGWATNNSDLGAEGVRWGASDVTGSLMATGSDNDKAIYAKFRFPCHPVVHRAGLGLAQLTGADKTAAINALGCRGRNFRGMRDALLPLVTSPTARPTGSVRDRRSWDVAEVLSKVCSRATLVQLRPEDDESFATCVVVPLHERLAHCDARGENAKLIGCDPRDEASGGDAVLLVATRDITKGEAITRDYTLAPRLPDDCSDGALRLLLQFGLPPAAWP